MKKDGYFSLETRVGEVAQKSDCFGLSCQMVRSFCLEIRDGTITEKGSQFGLGVSVLASRPVGCGFDSCVR